jgi:hypothetical protein
VFDERRLHVPRYFSVILISILVGCLVAPPTALATSSNPEAVRPFLHSSPVGTLTQTVEGDVVALRFKSTNERSLDLTVNRKTFVVTIGGLWLWTHAGRFVVSYKGQVVDGVVGDDGKPSEADTASVAYLIHSWRDDAGIGLELASLQFALHEYTLKSLSSAGTHPRPLMSCGWALFLYEGALINVIVSEGTFGSIMAFAAAANNLCQSCGCPDCFPVTGVEC